MDIRTNAEFVKAMGAEYEKLYNMAGNEPDGYNVLVWAFDTWIKASRTNKEILQEIVEERGDYITSDREAAAFMLTLEKAGVI